MPKTSAKVSIDFDLCDSSQVCTEVCPSGVFEFSNGTIRVNASACETCLKCVESCPEGAIEVDF